ncbi:hypothetical protein A946_03900 [Methylacidiphilum kamchatkense Kam1]|uniref:DUF4157 domain-containing protein n=2 Tax=Methylacidiphilum kamchatkense TaxID=431057 RepID=A0A0C1RW54_9BACT|nr:hypothetical protein A946_03900 [Methylacidiphilum kamchatkense Kam1]QDQ42917.1 hypothetical protein kam1_1702 [Methylacidiphilum kamchatkense Kam1]
MTNGFNDFFSAMINNLIARGISWAKKVVEEQAKEGRLLSDSELIVAKKVGVRYPERIRIVFVDQIPHPEDPQLLEIAQSYGLSFPSMIGLALGYTIFIRNNNFSEKLLAHECRHVYQFEQAGSIESYLQNYLQSLLPNGYANSPYEKDAQAWEKKGQS